MSAAGRNTGLGTLARIALGAGAAGFGWSAGRDLYRGLRKNLWPALAFAACAGGAGFAAWDLARGHRGGNGAWRTIRDVTVALGSLAIGTVALSAAAGPGAGGGAILLVIAVQALAALVGGVVGLCQRGRRVRAYRLEDHNVAFMQAQGLRDVGGREDTYLDGDDNELKLDDVRRDAMVFRVQGRRGKRAFIDLDGDGRMLAYRPPA